MQKCLKNHQNFHKKKFIHRIDIKNSFLRCKNAFINIKILIKKKITLKMFLLKKNTLNLSVVQEISKNFEHHCYRHQRRQMLILLHVCINKKKKFNN